MSPRGRTLTQKVVEELAQEESLLFLCGHYEGVDQRVLDLCIDEELSIGDYVLTGGELGALVTIDAVSRLIPGVLGCDESSEDESFSMGLLEYPQYTRPREYEGMEVPEVLLNGNNLYTHYKKMQYDVGFVPQSEMMRGKDTVLNTLLNLTLMLYLIYLMKKIK